MIGTGGQKSKCLLFYVGGNLSFPISSYYIFIVYLQSRSNSPFKNGVVRVLLFGVKYKQKLDRGSVQKYQMDNKTFVYIQKLENNEIFCTSK